VSTGAVTHGFRVVCELDSPVDHDRTRLHRGFRALSPVADAFLVTDNHTGRATVSSLVVAHAVARYGAPAIACLNARDRNLLGLRRDLATAAFLGIDELLLVRGDDPAVGGRMGALDVRTMLHECREARVPRVALAAGLGPLPAWKREADTLFAQVSWSIDDLLRWRESVDFAGPIIPAVLVLSSAGMARRLGARIPQLRAPDEWIAALERDPDAGVARACDLVERIRESGAFAGVHLIPGARSTATAAVLASAGRRCTMEV
jgi:methylenetetrahydrofolate reductase (NADPH)